MGEKENTLKWFKKDKSPGPNGWPLEFYIAFFDILGEDLLSIIEDFHTSGRMYEVFNSTFISLIPKIDCLESFNEFRPISLYNCIYKILAKIIANHLRPILSTHISLEKFSFLNNRQIHDVIGIAQEFLHYIKSKRLKGMIFNIDLTKSFDRAS